MLLSFHSPHLCSGSCHGSQTPGLGSFLVVHDRRPHPPCMPGLKQALVEGHQREACLVPPPRFAQRARLARVPWGLPLCPSLLAMPAWCLAAVCCAAGAPSTGCPLDWEAPRVLLRMDFPGGTKASVTLRHWCVMARSPEILWCQAVGAAWARGPLASALCCPRQGWLSESLRKLPHTSLLQLEGSDFWVTLLA